MKMSAVVTRILLRYASGVLVARGLLGSDDGSMFVSDPDVAMAIETGIGLALGAATEAWYYFARKFGWSK